MHLLQDLYLRDAGHHEPENIGDRLFGIRVTEHSFSDRQPVVEWRFRVYEVCEVRSSDFGGVNIDRFRLSRNINGRDLSQESVVYES